LTTVQHRPGRVYADHPAGQAAGHHDNDTKDGRINKAELGQLLKDAGIGSWLTRGAWADGIIAALDRDKDDTISGSEFEAVLQG
jgi:hypothetical protein